MLWKVKIKNHSILTRETTYIWYPVIMGNNAQETEKTKKSSVVATNATIICCVFLIGKSMENNPPKACAFGGFLLFEGISCF